MENGSGRALLCSPTFLFFILLITLFATETRKSKSTNEGKAIPNGELMFCSPIKMFHRFRGTKIYGKHRGQRFLNTRILYTDNGRSSFQLDRIVLCGDAHPQPVPTVKRNFKYPCKECGKSVRSNQDPILCAQCKICSPQCIGLSKGTFKHYLDNPDVDWTCGWCSLPFPFHDVDYYSEEEVDKEVSDLLNARIESESLYSSWKIAKLTPIFKKDDATEIGNYRPISLLSIPSKILESEVNDTLVHHVFKKHRLAS